MGWVRHVRSSQEKLPMDALSPMPSHIGDTSVIGRHFANAAILHCHVCGTDGSCGSRDSFSDRQRKKAKKGHRVTCRDCASHTDKCALKTFDGLSSMHVKTIQVVLADLPDETEPLVLQCLQPPAPVVRIRDRFECSPCDRRFLRVADAAQHCRARH